MIKGGQQRTKAISYTRKNGTTGEFTKPVMRNAEILKIANTESIADYIQRQQESWIGHVIRADDDTYIKQLTFADFPKGIPKKRGILNTTYRTVLCRYKKEKFTEKEMITKLKARDSRLVTATEHNSILQY